MCGPGVKNELVVKSKSVSDSLLDPRSQSLPEGVPFEDTGGEKVY